MSKTLTYKDLVAEFRCFKSDMSFDDAMLAWFDAAHEAHFRNLYIPPHWEFNPGHVKRHDPDDAFANEVIVDAKANALIKFGNLMERYSRLLKRAEDAE